MIDTSWTTDLARRWEWLRRPSDIAGLLPRFEQHELGLLADEPNTLEPPPPECDMFAQFEQWGWRHPHACLRFAWSSARPDGPSHASWRLFAKRRQEGVLLLDIMSHVLIAFEPITSPDRVAAAWRPSEPTTPTSRVVMEYADPKSLLYFSGCVLTRNSRIIVDITVMSMAWLRVSSKQ